MNQNGWQPISTAPKGENVLVARDRFTFIAKYVLPRTLTANDEAAEDWAEYVEDEDEFYCPEGWYKLTECDYCDIDYIRLRENPTHWMPLPCLLNRANS